MRDSKQFQETEVKFLDIDKDLLINKLKDLGAKELGEELLKEIIYYDKDLTWATSNDKRVRLRQGSKGTQLAYKENLDQSLSGAIEIEFDVSDFEQAKAFLEKVGLQLIREQEKKRHSFKLGEVTVDIDTWPQVPTYIELEGPSEQSLKEAAEKLGLDWKDAVFENARRVIENYYNIPVGKLRYFTFDRVEL